MRSGRSLDLIILLSLAYGLAFMHRQSVVPFFRELTELFHTSYAAAGGLMSAFFIAYAATLIPAGCLADRLSNRTMIIGGTLTIALATCGLALAPSYPYAILTRILTGMAFAVLHCASMRQLSALAPAGGRARVIAIREVGVALGVLGGMSGLPWLARSLDLATVFIVIAAPLLVIGLVFALTDRSRFAPVAGVSAEPIVRWNLQLSYLVPIAFCTFTVANGLISWMPTMLRLHHGLPVTAAGNYMSLLIITMIPATLVAGYLSDRYQIRSSVVALSLLLLTIAIPAWLLARSAPALIGSALLTGAGWGGSAAIVLVMAAEAGGAHAGWTVGIVTTVAQSASGLATYVLGWLFDLTGGFLGQTIYLGLAAAAGCIVSLAAGRVLGRPR